MSKPSEIEYNRENSNLFQEKVIYKNNQLYTMTHFFGSSVFAIIG